MEAWTMLQEKKTLICPPLISSILHFNPQVIILLYISMWLVHWLWRIGDDPDNCAIPYMTAIGDLLGTGLLAAAFQILWLVGDRDADVGE